MGILIGLILLMVIFVGKGQQQVSKEELEEELAKSDEFKLKHSHATLEIEISRILNDPERTKQHGFDVEIEKALDEMNLPYRDDPYVSGILYKYDNMCRSYKEHIILANRGLIDSFVCHFPYMTGVKPNREFKCMNGVHAGEIVNYDKCNEILYTFVTWIQETLKKQGVDLELVAVIKVHDSGPLQGRLLEFEGYTWKGSNASELTFQRKIVPAYFGCWRDNTPPPKIPKPYYEK